MARQFETFLTEDMRLGVGAATKTNPGGGILTGTKVNIASFAIGRASVTAVWDPGVVASGGQVTTTVAVPGAAISDKAAASHSGMGSNALIVSAHVSAPGVVTVILANLTGASVDLPSGTLSVLVFSHG